jgi:hypothetical protein
MAVMDYQTQEGLAGCGFSMKFRNLSRPRRGKKVGALWAGLIYRYRRAPYLRSRITVHHLLMSTAWGWCCW